MCVRDRYHGGVLVHGSAADGRHSSTSGYVVSVPWRHWIKGTVRELSQGQSREYKVSGLCEQRTGTC